MVKRSKVQPWMLKKEILILYYGLGSRRTPLLAWAPAVLAVMYLLSPIDLIPDFIPFFGYIDDVVIVPLLLNLAVKLLPADVREESMVKAKRKHMHITLIVILLILLALGLIVGIFFLIRHLMGH
jgi:uncharacterized membrane protein YkvA (DUF1232 family)